MPNSGDVGTAKSVRALDIAAGRLFASWGESVNKTVIYNQATAAFVRYWGTDGDTQALLADGGNVYLGGHWYQFAGPSPSVHFAAFDASTLVKEAVVTPIPYTPMGVFAIISDGAGGLWLGGDVVGDWGTPATKVKRLVHLTPGGSSGTTTTTSSTSTSSTLEHVEHVDLKHDWDQSRDAPPVRLLQQPQRVRAVVQRFPDRMRAARALLPQAPANFAELIQRRPRCGGGTVLSVSRFRRHVSYSVSALQSVRGGR